MLASSLRGASTCCLSFRKDTLIPMFGLPLTTLAILFGIPLAWIAYTVTFVVRSQSWVRDEQREQPHE